MILVKANKLNDQNNNKGVSVDIIKLPRAVKGNVIQINAATFPELFPQIMKHVFHRINEISKWIIGEKNLIANSSLPRKYVENEISQAIKGGFVK